MPGGGVEHVEDAIETPQARAPERGHRVVVRDALGEPIEPLVVGTVQSTRVPFVEHLVGEAERHVLRIRGIRRRLQDHRVTAPFTLPVPGGTRDREQEHDMRCNVSPRIEGAGGSWALAPGAQTSAQRPMTTAKRFMCAKYRSRSQSMMVTAFTPGGRAVPLET